MVVIVAVMVVVVVLVIVVVLVLMVVVGVEVIGTVVGALGVVVAAVSTGTGTLTRPSIARAKSGSSESSLMGIALVRAVPRSRQVNSHSIVVIVML